MVAYTSNSSTQEVEAGSSRVWGWLGLHGETLSQKSINQSDNQ
jgi:hypothetical protein